MHPGELLLVLSCLHRALAPRPSQVPSCRAQHLCNALRIHRPRTPRRTPSKATHHAAIKVDPCRRSRSPPGPVVRTACLWPIVSPAAKAAIRTVGRSSAHSQGSPDTVYVWSWRSTTGRGRRRWFNTNYCRYIPRYARPPSTCWRDWAGARVLPRCLRLLTDHHARD